ncbi:Hypothetical predicted protein [Pelobates cultripes]|uniref:Uncharacterized protein n=1 Tax=Pelobates cultripes TaxID=61616 RepID=A0AAD1WAE3_PELCU|nr:Hypothetical predicted protein [Pelobates cultripes]
MATELGPSSLQTPMKLATQKDGITQAFDKFWAKYMEITLQDGTKCPTAKPTHSNWQTDANPSSNTAKQTIKQQESKQGQRIRWRASQDQTRSRRPCLPQAAYSHTPLDILRLNHHTTRGITQWNHRAGRHRLPKRPTGELGETPQGKRRETQPIPCRNTLKAPTQQDHWRAAKQIWRAASDTARSRHA